MNTITTFLQGVLHELKHVNWPTQKEAFLYTALVIVLSLAIAYYLGLLDLIFTSIVETVL